MRPAGFKRGDHYEAQVAEEGASLRGKEGGQNQVKFLSWDVNPTMRKRLQPKKMLDKKNGRRYTPTILKALMFLDIGQNTGFLANRRDFVLNLSFKERERVNRLQFPQGKRLLKSKIWQGHGCPLEAEEFGF